jgi:hypothetical protein
VAESFDQAAAMHPSTHRSRARIVLTASLALFSIGGATFADTIRLNDGTVITGKIESLDGDVYRVRSETLGTLRLRKQDIKSIDFSDDATAESAVDASSVLALQQQLTQNATLFSMIQSLQDDPEIRAVLSDPEIASAIAAGDFATLMNHPKIIALTQHAKMREIIDAAQ